MSRNDANDISIQSRTIAACVGSLVTSFAVNPFDVARVRMQQSSAVQHMTSPLPNTPNRNLTTKSGPYSLPKGSFLEMTSPGSQLGVNLCCKDAFWYPSSMSYCVAADADICAINPPKPLKQIKTFGILRDIVQEEGVPVLWRGVSLMLVQAIPANVVYFIAYEQIRDAAVPILGQFTQQLSPIAAGGLARALSSTIVSPLELLKTRLQSVQAPPGSNAMLLSLKSLKETIAIDGYRSLWSGLGLTLWRDVPFSSIYWLSVEGIRSQFPGNNKSHSSVFTEAFISGMFGGIVASVVTTPFDVAKTRRQLGHSSCMSAHMGMLKFMKTISVNEGWKALFVGLSPRTLKVAPACAIMITSYEMGKRLLT